MRVEQAEPRKARPSTARPTKNRKMARSSTLKKLALTKPHYAAAMRAQRAEQYLDDMADKRAEATVARVKDRQKDEEKTRRNRWRLPEPGRMGFPPPTPLATIPGYKPPKPDRFPLPSPTMTMMPALPLRKMARTMPSIPIFGAGLTGYTNRSSCTSARWPIRSRRPPRPRPPRRRIQQTLPPAVAEDLHGPL